MHVALMKSFNKAFSALDSSLVTGIIANIFIAFALGASMKRMWCLLNTLQIITHITLLNVSLPENLNFCLKMILSISSMSIIPKQWVDKAINLFESQALILNNEIRKSKIEGFEDNSFLRNLGQFIILASALFILCLSILFFYLVGKKVAAI